MKPERQFRLFSIAVLALAALSCIQDSELKASPREVPPAQIESAQLEVDAVKEIDAINSGSEKGDESKPEQKPTAFAYGKAGLID